MRINLDYLKQFIDHKYEKDELKELLASIGIEVDEMINVNGTDVFEVEITPNRPDWLSHFGIAREVQAKNPSLNLKVIETERKNSIDESDFKVEIEDKAGCPRYSGAILKNIKVGGSSTELKLLIESFGMRSVNNIVDISNLILMTHGHPIHIFDLDKINGGKIIIRSAVKGEKIKPLDGELKKLDESDLIIADVNGPLAIAGVMGGESSGVTENTKNIFIESAWFNPSRVRKTSKKFGMKTDASYLFERGADIENTEKVVDLTIDTLLKEVVSSPEIIKYFDVYPEPLKKQIVRLEKDFPGKFTGIHIDEKAASDILTNLGFRIEEHSNYWNVEVPSFRVDINGHEDLVEDIIRIYGYDMLDTVLPGTTADSVDGYKKREFLDNMRSHFNANGYSEVINYSFHSRKDNSFFGDESNYVEIKNPIGSDFSVMRNSLIAGLLKNTATNRNNDFKRISLLESGTIFIKEGKKLIEKDVVSLSVSGYDSLPGWGDTGGKLFDFFIFKSHVFNYLKRTGLTFEMTAAPELTGFLKDESSFKILIGGEEAGFIGEVGDNVLNHYKNEEPVFTCQLDLDVMTEKRVEKNFKIWNRLPAATRDLSFLINRENKFSSIRKAIEKYRPEALEDYSLTDLYEGKGIPHDKISMLMNFRYRSSERTLTTEEVNDLHDSLTEKLTDELGVIRR
ncbi:MAG: phenylalanine--tRNA ligase subunit beta [Acidobacteriota bacterium]